MYQRQYCRQRDKTHSGLVLGLVLVFYLTSKVCLAQEKNELCTALVANEHSNVLMLGSIGRGNLLIVTGKRLDSMMVHELPATALTPDGLIIDTEANINSTKLALKWPKLYRDPNFGKLITTSLSFAAFTIGGHTLVIYSSRSKALILYRFDNGLVTHQSNVSLINENDHENGQKHYYYFASSYSLTSADVNSEASSSVYAFNTDGNRSYLDLYQLKSESSSMVKLENETLSLCDVSDSLPYNNEIEFSNNNKLSKLKSKSPVYNQMFVHRNASHFDCHTDGGMDWWQWPTTKSASQPLTGLWTSNGMNQHFYLFDFNTRNIWSFDLFLRAWDQIALVNVSARSLRDFVQCSEIGNLKAKNKLHASTLDDTAKSDANESVKIENKKLMNNLTRQPFLPHLDGWYAFTGALVTTALIALLVLTCAVCEVDNESAINGNGNSVNNHLSTSNIASAAPKFIDAPKTVCIPLSQPVKSLVIIQTTVDGLDLLDRNCPQVNLINLPPQSVVVQSARPQQGLRRASDDDSMPQMPPYI